MSLLRRRIFSFTTFELILLALFASLVVVSKIVLRLPVQIPGHSGVFWMALIVVARGIVPKPGALTLVGLTSAILATFLGLGDQGPIDSFFSYLALGVAADVTATFLRTVEHPITATLVGLAGNVAKMLTKIVLDVALGIPAGFVAFGLLYSFATNAIAGAIGGLLGWLVLVALRRAGFFAYLAEKR
jgi:ABC-type thiamin/hydroxymethylpyrimidine transport system permease subunit